MSKRLYEEPNVEVVYVGVEAGFTASQEWGQPGEEPEYNDYGEF